MVAAEAVAARIAMSLCDLLAFDPNDHSDNDLFLRIYMVHSYPHDNIGCIYCYHM